jgi:hypothetical protein
MLQTVKPLLEAAAAAKSQRQSATPADGSAVAPDPELIRAAVTIALDAALPNLIEEITKKVLTVLDIKNA